MYNPKNQPKTYEECCLQVDYLINWITKSKSKEAIEIRKRIKEIFKKYKI